MIKALLYAVGFAAAFGMGSSSAFAQTVHLGAGQQGAQNYQLNTVIASTLQTEGMTASVQSFSSAVSYLTLLESGELDIVATPSVDVYDALTGREAFEGNALENVRILAVLHDVPYGIIVRSSDDIDSIEDLRGKRIAYGYSSRPAMQNDVDALLANGGLTIDDVRPVSVPGVVQGVDAFITGRVDAVYYSVRSGKVVEANAAVGGLSFISLSDDEDAIAAMREHSPTAGVMEISPSEGQAGIPEPRNLLSFPYVLLGGADLSEDVAYEVVRILYENADSLAEESRLFTGLDKSEFARDLAGLPFHPAALRFYEEKGIAN